MMTRIYILKAGCIAF